MPRLRTIPSRLATAPSRLKPAGEAAPTYGQGRGGRPWRRLRDQVMKRDGHMCQCEQCQGRVLIAHEVDHIVPLSQGGTDDPANLRAMHRDCHKAKTAREARHAGE